MTAFIIIVSVFAVLFLLYVLSLKGNKKNPETAYFQKVRYAHRGFHSKPTIPENSLFAFSEAVKRGYGIELDVHLMADGKLAVIHDASLKRTAGTDRIIEEMTEKELADYTLEESDERIPTFSEVLSLVDGKVPLVIELKSEKNTEALCKALINELKDYKGKYCIESFDPRVLFWFRKNRPEITRGQLSKNFIKEPTEHKFHIRFLLTSLLCNFLTNPDFIAYQYSHRKDLCNIIATKFWRLQAVSWTIKNKKDAAKAKSEGAMIIFEDFLA
jgi:glycerophosphoryl diester phosphodiesterase